MPVFVVDGSVWLTIIQVYLVVVDDADFGIIIFDPLRVVQPLRLCERPVMSERHASAVVYHDAAQVEAVVRYRRLTLSVHHGVDRAVLVSLRLVIANLGISLMRITLDGAIIEQVEVSVAVLQLILICLLLFAFGFFLEILILIPNNGLMIYLIFFYVQERRVRNAII